MVGILNPKSRLMDTILTSEGRKQLAEGKLKATFYSFTDSGMHYSQETIVSGGLDDTYRIQFEASNCPQDMISLRADDSGKLTGFPVSGSDKYIFRNGQILSSSNPENTTFVTLSGSEFASLSEPLLASTINNFCQQYILRSPSPLENEGKQFTIGPSEANFIITPERPFPPGSISTVDVNQAENFYQDKRLSHIPNYAFMPPVNRKRLGDNRIAPLGEYVNINQEPILSYPDLLGELNRFEAMGYKQTIRFTENSKEGNIMCQFFESAGNELSKMDVIDFGTFPDTNGNSRHVFFAGKVYSDEKNVHTFINLFTLVFRD